MNKPKKQHTVPAFCLARFTREGTDDGVLWVTDKLQMRQWMSPARVASTEKNFYTGDFGREQDPYGVEKAFSRCEAKWAAVTRAIIESAQVPKGGTEEHAELMGFVAFQAMRVRRTREYITALVDEQSKAELVTRLAAGEDWDGFVKHMAATGQALPFSREEMIQMALEGNFVVDVDQTPKMQMQLMGAINLMPRLAAREWSLLIAAEESTDFVCSDSPVCVTLRDGSMDLRKGFCEPGSVVTIPLGPRHALAGFYEFRANLVLPARDIAGLNAKTIQHCRQVYSVDSTFSYLRTDGQIGCATDFVKQ